MLSEEPENPAAQLQRHLRLHLLAALSAQMNDLADRRVENLPAGLSEAIAPVRLLGVHEETLVHGSDLLDRLATDQHETPGDHLHLSRTVMVPTRHVLPAKEPAPGEYLV